jgi:hypothetical protein
VARGPPLQNRSMPRIHVSWAGYFPTLDHHASRLACRILSPCSFDDETHDKRVMLRVVSRVSSSCAQGTSVSLVGSVDRVTGQCCRAVQSRAIMRRRAQEEIGRLAAVACGASGRARGSLEFVPCPRSHQFTRGESVGAVSWLSTLAPRRIGLVSLRLRGRPHVCCRVQNGNGVFSESPAGNDPVACALH